MKKFIAIFVGIGIVLTASHKLFSQSGPEMQEFGITAGGFTNFPADKNYLKNDISVFYVAPYIRVGRHEFSAGILYPLSAKPLYFNGDNILPRPGALARYKFYIFNVFGRENLFVHYTFQYLRFKGNYDVTNIEFSNESLAYKETDMYINNVIGIGYNIFFDTGGRFGLYYTLDYVISQTSSITESPFMKDPSWATNYVWNNLSTHVGFIFKITSLKKKEK